MSNNLGNKQIMAKNIQYYMNLHGKTRQEMCDALGVKYTTFTDWVKGNAYPRRTFRCSKHTENHDFF